MSGNIYVTPTRLPEQYQAIEYIEGTGTQYINTGTYLSTNTLAMEVDFQLTSTEYDTNTYILGCCGSSISRFYVIVTGTNDSTASKRQKLGYGIGNGYTTASTTTDLDRHIYKIDMNNLQVLKDGISISAESGSWSKKTDNTLWLGLFRGLNSNDEMQTMAKGKLYRAKIWQTDILIHDYVPCYRKSDNETGLYDIIENIFYTNAGEENFSKGNDIDFIIQKKKIPNNYKRVDCLLSNKSTLDNKISYIDTNTIPTSNTKVKINGFYNPFSLKSHPQNEIFGSYYRVTYDSVYGFHIGFSQEETYLSCFFSGSTIQISSYKFKIPENIVPFMIECDFKKSKTIIELGEQKGEIYGTSFSSNNNLSSLFLFTYHRISTVNSTTTDSAYGDCLDTSISSCKIYESEVLIHDYIPIIDINNNNTAGFYDLVENIGIFPSYSYFSYNSIIENNALYAQKVSNVYVSNNLPNDYRKIDYIQTNGTYINTDYILTEFTDFTGKFKLPNEINNQYLCYCVSDNNKIFEIKCNNINGIQFHYQQESSIINDPDSESGIGLNIINNNQIFNIDKTLNKLIVYNDNNSEEIEITPSYFSSINTLQIGGINSSIYIYYFKLYEKNILKAYFIPCERKNDNTLGLYNLCNNTFYPCLNTEQTEYIPEKGNNITNTSKATQCRKIYTNINNNIKLLKHFPYIPKQYQQVEYVETSGNVVLDLGFIGYRGLGYDIDFIQYKNVTTSGFGTIFGSRTNASRRRYWLSSYNGGMMDYGNTTSLQKQGMLKGTRQNFSVRDNYFGNDNRSYTKFSSTDDFTTPSNITLFSGHNGSGTSQIQNGNARIYSLKFYNNYNIQNDYYPCYRLNDNTIGFYDKISKKFLTAETGTLIKGDNIIKRL